MWMINKVIQRATSLLRRWYRLPKDCRLGREGLIGSGVNYSYSCPPLSHSRNYTRENVKITCFNVMLWSRSLEKQKQIRNRSSWFGFGKKWEFFNLTYLLRKTYNGRIASIGCPLNPDQDLYPFVPHNLNLSVCRSQFLQSKNNELNEKIHKPLIFLFDDFCEWPCFVIW